MSQIDPQLLEPFLKGYKETMLWTNTMAYNTLGELKPTHCFEINFEKPFSFCETLAKTIQEDCECFLDMEGDDSLDSTREQLARFLKNYGPEKAGRCFALSRNGHGAGFIDYQDSDHLKRRAKSFGAQTWEFYSPERLVSEL